MTRASDNLFPRLLISEGGSTATPGSGEVTVYAKSDGLLYSKDDGGTETALGGTGGGGGGSGMANPMTSAGDMIVEGGGVDRAYLCSTSSSGEYAGLWHSSYAVDGTGNGSSHRWGDSGSPAWLKLDLGAAYTIAAFRLGAGADWWPQYEIQYSVDGSTGWTTVYTSPSSPSADSGVVSITPVSSRYWRYLAPDHGEVWIFQLFDAVIPGRLAVGAQPKLLGISDTGFPAWILPTIRHAAGVPSGAPAGAELPIAVDTTASPGDWYFWSGSAWTR